MHMYVDICFIAGMTHGGLQTMVVIKMFENS